jgi:hypothetical protein
MDRDEMERRMNAVRDVVQPAERLTIVRTDAMVIITTGDGRTTRLAPDNSRIKDQSSGIERRTHWDGERLVSEINGLGRGRATETYSLDPQTHQLVVDFDLGGGNTKPDTKDSGSPSAREDDRGDRRGPGGPGGPGLPRVPRKRVYDPLP